MGFCGSSGLRSFLGGAKGAMTTMREPIASVTSNKNAGSVATRLSVEARCGSRAGFVSECVYE